MGLWVISMCREKSETDIWSPKEKTIEVAESGLLLTKLR